jgi:hypothetical protein
LGRLFGKVHRYTGGNRSTRDCHFYQQSRPPHVCWGGSVSELMRSASRPRSPSLCPQVVRLPFPPSVVNTERSCSEVMLPWATKPERSCRAIKLTTVVAFVSAVFVRPVDVTHADSEIAFGAYVTTTRARCATGPSLFSGGIQGTHPNLRCAPLIYLPGQPRRSLFATDVVLS